MPKEHALAENRAHRHTLSSFFPVRFPVHLIIQLFIFYPSISFLSYSWIELLPRPSTHIGWEGREGDSAPAVPLAGTEVHVFHPSLSPFDLCVEKLNPLLFPPGFPCWLLSLWVGHFCVSTAKSSL